MDVSLLVRRGAWAFFSLLLMAACGNRYDLSTEAGQQARISDANAYLSIGDCADASNSIGPLYNSSYRDDQVKLIYASTQACYAHFNLLTFAADLAGGSSFFNGLAIALPSTANDGSIQWMYNATDVMTQSGTLMSASQRSTADNDYMVFVQLGVISAIMRNYGNPNGSGAPQSTLTYNPGTMSDTDACALTAAFSFITDSFGSSDLSDSTTKSAVSSLNTICQAAISSTCSGLNKDRTQCATNATDKTQATAVVNAVNLAW